MGKEVAFELVEGRDVRLGVGERRRIHSGGDAGQHRGCAEIRVKAGERRLIVGHEASWMVRWLCVPP